MVGTSKILTVSYGTFSCTLEGFDDPFSTMKSISEYFRDLAAEDRYFGAEPPTPDAEMLHRIAEKEIQRRVESRVQDNAVYLRQMEPEADTRAPAASVAALATAAQSGPADKTQSDATDAAPTAAAPKTAEQIQPDASAQTQEPPEETTANPELFFDAETQIIDDAPQGDALSDGSIAAKLSRIRAVVSASAPEQAYSEDEHAVDSPDDALAAMFDDEDADTAADYFDDEEDSASEYFSDEDQTDAPTQEVFNENASEQAAEELDIALENAISAEASPTESDTFDVAADPEHLDTRLNADDGEVEDDDVAEADFVAADDAIGAEEDDALDDAVIAHAGASAQDVYVEDMDDGEEIDLAALASELSEPAMMRDDKAQDTAGDAGAEISVDTLIDTIAQEDMHNIGADVKTSAIDAEGDATADLDTQEHAEVADEAPQQEAADPADPLETASHAVATDFVSRARARIVKMRRADMPELAAPEDGRDGDASDQIAEMLGEGTLPADEESDLIAQLAAASGVDDPSERLAKEDRVARSKLLEENPIDETGNVGRLMEETDRAFSNTEGSRRRSAIQHLKAAVMARRSDDDAIEQGSEESVKSRFADDLARVVQPSRPTASAKKTERRLAPLMLVSEQRVDVTDMDEPAAPVSPVRPRRVSTGNLVLQNDYEDDLDQAAVSETAVADAASFADYADKVGAENLTDLLEAAAAYASYVEGQPHFSRPQIMKTVADLKADEGYTREDGLRSFGTLLRTGKIKKLKRGQFVVADNTRFKPEERFAGE
ncbi:hypothetical protein ACP2AV_11290 [Aliiroseovarius sp. PTFE2010]|uniref:hypothetical protein n=1 Tax=Aliiroseovarius sp. PTFE2010 TaxID=3417190 RepID=UPI003CFAD070